MGVKDVLSLSDLPTTIHSEADSLWSARGEAPVVAAIRDAGAIVCGTTTAMELMMGYPELDGRLPVPRNPYDSTRWTGGSSSGNASGLASKQFLAAIGTDTAGSPSA